MAQLVSVLPDGTLLYDDGSTSWVDPSQIPRQQSTYADNGIPTGASTPYRAPTNEDYLAGMQGNITLAGQQNAGILGQLGTAQTNYFNYQNQLGAQNQGYADQSTQIANNLTNQLNGFGQQSWNGALATNAANTGLLGNYTQALQNAASWDAANLGGLQGAYSQTGILKAGGYGPDVVSQAATARADPNSIAAQNLALSQLQGAANGSLNVTSKAAQAYADPQDVANQKMAANALQAAANGSKDVNFWALPGIGELHNVAQGSQDVTPGQLDPEAYASEKDALSKFTALTNPEVTAQERFIYEQARLQQEQDERNQRAAILTNLRARGMSGSGAEIGSAQLAGQQTSENRLLSDLGAQSNAVQRAMQALGGQADLSSAMTAQANALAQGNQGVRVNALNNFVGIGADVEQNNMNRQLAAQEAASQAYATLRAQGFSEEYARGQAADIVATANSDRQLNAMNASGNLASNMRAQSFNEDFQTKSAADQMAQFNKEQSQISQRWQEQYAAGQQTDAWNRATDLFTAADKVGRNYAQDQGNLWNAGFQTNQGNNQNIQTSLGLQGGFAAQGAYGQQNALNTHIGANQVQSNTYAQQLAAMTQLGMVGMNNNTQLAGLQNGVYGTTIGYNQGQAAAAAAKPPTHAFGLGSGPHETRGLLGGYIIGGIL